MSTIGYINISMEMFGGLLSLIFIICISITHRRKEPMELLFKRLLICNTILLFSDATAWLFKGRHDLFSFFAVHISNFLVFTLGYLMLVLFTHYLMGFLNTKGIRMTKIPLYVICGIMLLAMCLVVLSQFNGMYYHIDSQNIYHRQRWFWVSQTFGVFGMILNGGIIICYHKKLKRKELWAFVIYICLPATALLAQILFYGIAVLYLATTICLLCMYISIQMELYQEVCCKELELEKIKTTVMLSQIQPHFLYNALTGIKALCGSDPERAEDAMEHFSFFMRSNLDSLVNIQLITFEKEISHVNDYFYLEKMRFQDRVSLVLELEFRDFILPPLTLQPLVENAIRYGITKKEIGGTVTIRSREQNGQVLISVTDDGVGFDVDASQEDGRSHTGIDNVRRRLQMQCGGLLEIQSSRGVGTEVRIALPKKEKLLCEYSKR